MTKPTPAESDFTQGGELTEHLHRARKRFLHAGVLTPVNAETIGGAAEFRLQRGEMVIGRDAGCDAVIADVSVSRQHARVTLEENDFYIEDLESRNGTYVDGIRVMLCVLRDGDEVQIGRYLFYFDHVLEEVKGFPPPQ